jgi:hypothetical protein
MGAKSKWMAVSIYVYFLFPVPDLPIGLKFCNSEMECNCARKFMEGLFRDYSV